MKLSFPKTPRFREKQALCKQIATAYRDENLKLEAYASDYFGKPLGEPSTPAEGFVYTVSESIRQAETESIREAERYDRLAESPWLYLRREDSLRRVLGGVPIGRFAIIAAIQTRDELYEALETNQGIRCLF